jgi:hypothetical protein
MFIIQTCRVDQSIGLYVLRKVGDEKDEWVLTGIQSGIGEVLPKKAKPTSRS